MSGPEDHHVMEGGQDGRLSSLWRALMPSDGNLASVG